MFNPDTPPRFELQLVRALCDDGVDRVAIRVVCPGCSGVVREGLTDTVAPADPSAAEREQWRRDAVDLLARDGALLACADCGRCEVPA